MARLLVLAAFLWPIAMASAVWPRIDGHASGWSALVYLGASTICHQKPERSFHTAGVAWPVCARCSGLYVAAPLGALAALVSIRRRPGGPRRLTWLAIASLPTIVTVVVEWSGVLTPSNAVRASAAVPVGAMIAFVLVHTAGGAPRPIR